MTFTDRKIVETYSKMLEGLNPASKFELIERLAKSLKKDKKKKEKEFFKSFGAFASEKTAEEIIADIKGSTRFKRKVP
jgi:hypothetical protein